MSTIPSTRCTSVECNPCLSVATIEAYVGRPLCLAIIGLTRQIYDQLPPQQAHRVPQLHGTSCSRFAAFLLTTILSYFTIQWMIEIGIGIGIMCDVLITSILVVALRNSRTGIQKCVPSLYRHACTAVRDPDLLLFFDGSQCRHGTGHPSAVRYQHRSVTIFFPLLSRCTSVLTRRSVALAGLLTTYVHIPPPLGLADDRFWLLPQLRELLLLRLRA